MIQTVKLDMLIAYSVLILSTLSTIVAENGTCERTKSSWYELGGTATMYDIVRGHENLTVEGCTPYRIWSFFRHGVKQYSPEIYQKVTNILPDLKKKISEAHSYGRGTLCDEDVEEISRWRVDMLSEFEASMLTYRGRMGAYELSRRMKNHFPNLLNQTFDPALFYFGHSNSQRTLGTLRGFVEGFYREDSNFVSAYIGEIHPVAKYDCLSYAIKEYEDDYEKITPSYIYANKTQLFETIADNLSDRTGLHRQHFNSQVIALLFEVCTFETALNAKFSPWCSVFGEEDVHKMLLRHEFFYHVGLAGGHEYRNEIGCTQIKSLITSLNDSVKNKSNGYVMESYFGHGSNILQILSKMGCCNPGVIDDYINFDYKCNLSNISPFGANLVAVLYLCGEDTNNYKLQFYLNEKPMGCCLTKDTGACDWVTFRDRWSDFVLNCKDDYCDKNEEKNSSSKYFIIPYSLLLVVINLFFLY